MVAVEVQPPIARGCDGAVQVMGIVKRQLAGKMHRLLPRLRERDVMN